MEFEKEEREVEELLKNYKLKSPPESLLKNYVEEVRKKIDTAPKDPVFGFPVVFFAIAVALGLVGGFVFFLRPALTPRKEAVPPLVTVSDEAKVVPQEMEQAIKLAAEPSGAAQETQKPEAVPASVASEETPSVGQEAAPVEKIPTKGTDLDKMAKDLFVLEALGEDEGLLEEFERMETDIEFFDQTAEPLSKGAGL